MQTPQVAEEFVDATTAHLKNLARYQITSLPFVPDTSELQICARLVCPFSFIASNASDCRFCMW